MCTILDFANLPICHFANLVTETYKCIAVLLKLLEIKPKTPQKWLFLLNWTRKIWCRVLVISKYINDEDTDSADPRAFHKSLET